MENNLKYMHTHICESLFYKPETNIYYKSTVLQFKIKESSYTMPQYNLYTSLTY